VLFDEVNKFKYTYTHQNVNLLFLSDEERYIVKGGRKSTMYIAISTFGNLCPQWIYSLWYVKNSMAINGGGER